MSAGEWREFGAVLRRFRLAAGLTHELLAERAAVSARTISDLERGVSRAPRRETLSLLAEALALTPEQRDVLECAARAHVSQGQRADPAHNLPAQFTSFIGRTDELHAVRELLQQPGTRLVTLTGAGGSGKTRLALRVAEVLLPAFPDGVFFVPLAPVADAGDIPAAVAQAMGLAPKSVRVAEAAAIAALQSRRILLLLDNAEHLLSGTPLLTRLLAACPWLKMLVTSRAALRLSAEWEFPVLPLPVPDLRHLPPTDALSHYAAVALFVERATRVLPGFCLTDANAAAVAAICGRLDGLPLALELAAARIKALSPQALLARLEPPTGSALRLLTGGARDLPQRQQTLRDTIAWSYDMLPPNERRLFCRMAIFAGGCSLEAAEAVAGDVPRSTFQVPRAERDTLERGTWNVELSVLDGLASLVDKSLLHRDGGAIGEPRFGMLETVREFALERLAATGELATIGERHTRYYLAMVESSGAVLLGGAHHPQRLAAERDNIRAALRALVTSG